MIASTCPDCGSVLLRRRRSRGVHVLLNGVSRKRPHRCLRCGWTGRTLPHASRRRRVRGADLPIAGASGPSAADEEIRVALARADEGLNGKGADASGVPRMAGGAQSHRSPRRRGRGNGAATPRQLKKPVVAGVSVTAAVLSAMAILLLATKSCEPRREMPATQARWEASR